MNKKLLVALAAVSLSLTILPSSKAEEVKPGTLAIIDTALNTSLPEIKNNVVYEVCILDWPTCSNKTNFQEGVGAASMPLNQMMLNGFSHGTQMTYSAISANSNVKIIFIRFVGATANGTRQITNESSFVNALNWVYANKDKFNIKAVAMSQSNYNPGLGINYCPNTPNTASVITKLMTASVPVFLSAGNNRDLKRISWPACTPSAIAVSASAYGDGPAVFTNYDANLTDIFARGDLKVLAPNGTYSNEVGSSISTQIAASTYVGLANKYPTYTYDQLWSLFKIKTIPLVSRTIKGALIIDPKAALNG